MNTSYRFLPSHKKGGRASLISAPPFLGRGRFNAEKAPCISSFYLIELRLYRLVDLLQSLRGIGLFQRYRILCLGQSIPI